MAQRFEDKSQENRPERKRLNIVGKSAVRIDALEKVKGTAHYCSDVKLPGMLYLKVLRSPHPHARIISIDTSAAGNYPGVRYVATGKDIPDKRYGLGLVKDQTVLARDVAIYAGEPVAAVAAETIEAADEAIELIKVRYEVLPAVTDPEEALGPNPPAVVHPDFPDYEKGVRGPRLDLSQPNVFTHMMIRHGDVDKAFKEADLIVENRYVCPPFQHAPLETHDAVVRPEADGGLTVWTGRQALWTLKGILAELYNIKPSKIRIIQQYVGGAFGGKMKTMEVIPAFMALKTGRPVKWVFTREEEFIDGGHREPMVIYIKDGVKKDGTLIAREIKAVLNGCAYENIISIVTRNCAFGSVATYRTPNLKWDSYGVYTNMPPGCAFRGFGVAQTVFAVESNMDVIAEKLGIDKVEIRRKNILKEGETNATGEVTHSIGVADCLEKAVDYIKLEDKEPSDGPWRRGKGIAIGNKYSTAMALCGAKVQVTEEEAVVVYHGADEIGQGCNTVMAQIAAEDFGVSVDDVKIVFSDTATAPFFADGSTSSRVTYQLGNAVRMACADAKKKLFERAAIPLEVSPDELDTKNKVVYVKNNPDNKIRISELFSGFHGRRPDLYGGVALGGEIIGVATNIQEYAPEDPATGQIDPLLAAGGKRLNSFYAHVAKSVEVAVNIETGQVKVLRCAGAVDLGKMINPKMCEQQSEGGLMMGICDAIYEEQLMKDGVVMNPNLTDYRFPSVKDFPEMKNMVSFFIESAPHKDGPFGAKGFGEGAMIAMEAAIANAIYDAVGIRLTNIPFTPERVLNALKAKKGEQQ